MANIREHRDTKSEEPGQREGVARREQYPASPWVSPFTFMRRFSDEMDRLFATFGTGRGWLGPRFREGEMGHLWSPSVEVFQRGDELVIRADLPGLNKDDIRVEVHDEELTIQGERRQEHKEEREGFYHSERSYGSFYRTVPLPEGAKVDSAKASFKDGVLEILMPAPPRQAARGRRIEIQEASGPATSGGAKPAAGKPTGA